jgi:peptidyl-tRNA hydrolase, PTH1 family
LEQGIKIVVGLGNPGPQYEHTRHNVGVWFLHALAEKYHANLQIEPKFKGLFDTVEIVDHKCFLLFPTTFMNLSGQAVRAATNFYKITPEEILVVHDELDFPPGAVRLKKGGGDNGHNGVENIITQLGSADFYRLRIGIGKPVHRDVMKDFVLSKPLKSEKELIISAIDHAVEILPDLIQGNFQRAMNVLHSPE